MNELVILIFLPLLISLLLLVIPGERRILKGIIALLASLAAFIPVISAQNKGSRFLVFSDLFPGVAKAGSIYSDAGKYLALNYDNISRFILVCICIFSVIVILYSLVYLKTLRTRNYFSYILITLGCSFGAVLADNLLLFLGFWGVLGITLYKLTGEHDEESSATAKKTLILIGSSDSIMIIGIAIIWVIAGSLNISEISLSTDNTLGITAFLALLAGSLTKTGAFPFHTWVPDYSVRAPVTSSAYLPASLDKLLGIYFLARITGDIFILNEWMKLLLITLGVISIMSAVMMALVQHDYKRLLGYHAVSQAGYMVLAFGLGSALGIAAGLFHMLNNTLYKTGLFLAAGSVEYRTGKNDINDLGGLSRAMPVTFIASLVFAMSISGIPPFNGFASKWIIYQGIIEYGSGTGISNKLWVVWLGLAVLGSALTLASFIKFIGGIFLGRYDGTKKITEVPALMWAPVAFLALICIFLGVFATEFAVPEIIMPVSGKFEFPGIWNSSTVALLVLLSIIIGLVIYAGMNLKNFRREDSFMGGEKIQDMAGYPVTGFYDTISQIRIISWFYGKAGERWFDVYDLSKRSILWLSHYLSEAHSGVLTGYILWALAGLIIILLIMV